jgi:hypothetical protein
VAEVLAAPVAFDYLVVAGGGGGGKGYWLEEVELEDIVLRFLEEQNYISRLDLIPITVGAGGAGDLQLQIVGTGGNGNPSIFSTITSTGGGGGGLIAASCW